MILIFIVVFVYYFDKAQDKSLAPLIDKADQLIGKDTTSDTEDTESAMLKQNNQTAIDQAPNVNSLVVRPIAETDHIRGDLAGDQPQDGRLARTVGADHPDLLGGMKLQVEIVENNLTAERFMNITKCYERHLSDPVIC